MWPVQLGVAPYYQDSVVAIFHGDCRELLPMFPRESIDLIVTDPPYGVAWQSGRRRTIQERIIGDDGALDVAACLRLAMPALRERRHLYVFGRPDLSGLPLGPCVELIWDKGVIGPGDLTLPWGPQHEPITFACHVSRPQNRARGDGRLTARLRRGSVIRCQRLNSGQLEDRQDRGRTEKPVEVLRQLIEASSLLGETVLDPFMGRGSTLVAAQLEGRQAVGIDLDERECEKAALRLTRATQGALL